MEIILTDAHRRYERNSSPKKYSPVLLSSSWWYKVLLSSLSIWPASTAHRSSAQELNSNMNCKYYYRVSLCKIRSAPKFKMFSAWNHFVRFRSATEKSLSPVIIETVSADIISPGFRIICSLDDSAPLWLVDVQSVWTCNRTLSGESQLLNKLNYMCKHD